MTIPYQTVTLGLLTSMGVVAFGPVGGPIKTYGVGVGEGIMVIGIGGYEGLGPSADKEALRTYLSKARLLVILRDTPGGLMGFQGGVGDGYFEVDQTDPETQTAFLVICQKARRSWPEWWEGTAAALGVPVASHPSTYIPHGGSHGEA